MAGGHSDQALQEIEDLLQRSLGERLAMSAGTNKEIVRRYLEDPWTGDADAIADQLLDDD